MERKAQFTKGGIEHATINGHRFHLRRNDPMRQNLLWVDGQSPPLILDPVATDFVSLIIDGMWEFQQGEGDESEQVRQYVVDAMFEKYGRMRLRTLPLAFRKRPTAERIRADLDRIFGTLMGIADGACPVEQNLQMKRLDQTKWIAPARIDLAITYDCNLDCRKCYLGCDRKGMKELSADEYVRVFEILWKIGVPQVVFTGGEPTCRKDLVRLVTEAQEFVTGLVTNGTRLAELAEPLRDASLDYVQVTLESHDAAVHNRMVGAAFDAHKKTIDGIRRALELKMQVVTNTTLTRDNAADFPRLLRFGKELGLKDMACNDLICSGRGTAEKKENGLSVDEIKKLLVESVTLAQELGVNLQWYTPTCYRQLNPVELGLGAKACSAAAHNMTIQPDGSVLPCQSWPEAVGNILEVPWGKIWNHPVCRKLRVHGYRKEKEECERCEHVGVCGGGCPLEKKK